MALALTLAVGGACQDPEAGVLVNVQLESSGLQVSELRLRGWAVARPGQVLEVTRARADGALFGQTENIFLLVPRSWIGQVAWLQAEGRHEGVTTAHGYVSVIPREHGVVETTLLLVAGEFPCGNGVLEPHEQCDGTLLGDHSCASLTGRPDGVPRCVDCRLDLAPCHDCGDGVLEAGPEACDGENLGGESCQSLGFLSGELGCTDDCRLDLSACEQGCGNGVAEPGEECDGSDLRARACPDLGYLWGHLSCTTDCALDESGCVGVCGDGVLDSLEDCDGTDFGEQTCQTAAGRVSGSLGCTTSCHLDVADCHTCGDGIIEGDEGCDGPSLGGQTCLDQGFDGGALACDSSCQIDTTGCTLITCGNGAIDSGEQCDGTDLGGADCVSRGFDAGSLACTVGCQFDESQCQTLVCGDGLVTGTEQCDLTNLNGTDCFALGFGGGTLACTAGCQFDTSGCLPLASDCGNGYVSSAEQCDDGNLVAGDGCDGNCLTEPGYRCFDDPSTCVPDSAGLFVDCGVSCPGTGTLADPFCEIWRAVDVASPGQLIWLLSTPCVEDVVVGPTHADLVISGDPGAQWAGTSCPTLTVDDRQVLVYGITLSDGIVVNTGGALTLRHSEVGPSASACEGVRCNVGAYCEVERTHIHGNAAGGIFTNGGSFRLANNIIVENGTPGPGGTLFGGVRLAQPAAPPAEVMNNTVAYNMTRANQSSGFKCFGTVVVRNNILWMNTPDDIDNNCDPWFSIISDPSWNNLQGNLNLDPIFVNQPAGDYHIQSGSPAVDSADPAGIPPAPPADFDGQSRSTGSGVDMGADEVP